MLWKVGLDKLAPDTELTLPLEDEELPLAVEDSLELELNVCSPGKRDGSIIPCCCCVG